MLRRSFLFQTRTSSKQHNGPGGPVNVAEQRQKIETLDMSTVPPGVDHKWFLQHVPIPGSVIHVYFQSSYVGRDAVTAVYADSKPGDTTHYITVAPLDYAPNTKPNVKADMYTVVYWYKP